MTTVAYRNGVIAADTGLTGGSLQDCEIDKIVKREDGAVAGAAGAAGEAWWIVAFLEWFKTSKGDAPVSKDFNTGLIVDRRRKITLVESGDGVARPYQIRAKYYAIGSGRQIATGALFVGAHPIDAVKAAMAHDDGTYGKIETYKVGW